MHTMNNKPGRLNNAGYRILSMAGVRRGVLVVLLVLSVFLQGCFLDRLVSLRSQACALDDNFGIEFDQDIAIEFYNPVLLENDMRLILGASPTTVLSSETGSTMRYLFQRVPGETGNGGVSSLNELNLDFDFTLVGEELRLSKISSNDLPAELLSMVPTISVSQLDEIGDFACQFDVNPFTRSMKLPLDPTWFNELPARDELIALFGAPNSTLDDGNGLIYKFSLEGSDVESHTATLVIRYDEIGEKPLTVEAGFGRYQMHTDLLTALMKVQFTI